VTSWPLARLALEDAGVPRLRDGDCFWVAWHSVHVLTDPPVMEALLAEARRKVAETALCAPDEVEVHQVSAAELVAAQRRYELFTDPTWPVPDLSGAHAVVAVWRTQKHEAAQT
jgi:hypothetical protein